MHMRVHVCVCVCLQPVSFRLLLTPTTQDQMLKHIPALHPSSNPPPNNSVWFRQVEADSAV